MKIAIVSGKDEGPTKLNAFDNALTDAGIGDVNLIKVSSMLSRNTEITELPTLKPGSMINCVLSEITSDNPGDEIIAVVALAIGDELGCVVEKTAINKNTDEVHAVLIHRDDDWVINNLEKRINAVLDNDRVPLGIHDKPTFFECKCCSFKGYCYDHKELPHNCRTCICHDLKNNGCIFDLNEYNNKCYTQIKVEMNND